MAAVTTAFRFHPSDSSDWSSMFLSYLRRELSSRRKQTLVVAIGMALAIALVIIVHGVTAGVRTAQASVLEGVYGVGTDIAITQASAPGTGGPQRFEFGADEGTADDEAGSTRFGGASLQVQRGAATLDEATLGTVTGIDGVASATATLSLSSTEFSGEIPSFDEGARPGGAPGEGGAPPSGGADGGGGSAFSLDSLSIEGVAVDSSSVGPVAATSLVVGRYFDSGDAAADVALVSESYAGSEELTIGDTVTVGSTDVEIVGIVASSSASAATSAEVYLPLARAQELAGLIGSVTTVYVQAVSADAIAEVRRALEVALPDATVSTQAELAETVSGSLSDASSLLTGLGRWLSGIVLAAAFVIAILFTVSGVASRTREFGTLKAIGWSNGRVVRQIAGESLVQGALGGVIGIALGLGGLAVVSAIGPTLSASTAAAGGGVGPGGGIGGTGGLFGEIAGAATEITLSAPVTPAAIALAVGLAVLGGLLAGMFGGWRAARLRPAEALRSLA